MATESFMKNFEVNRKSVDSMIEILKSDRQAVLNQKKTYVKINRKEINDLLNDKKVISYD